MAGDETNSGWISIYRRIREHWIWQDPVKFKWWIDIILTVNHEDKKVNIGMRLIECKRGQAVMSLRNWADRWKVSRDSTRNFLELLKKDGMITTENLINTTRITVCNYDDYQGGLRTSQTLAERQPNASQTPADTNNNSNNSNKGNKEIDKSTSSQSKSKKFDFKKSLIDYGFDSKLVEEWLSIRKSKKAVNSELAFKNFITEVKETGMNINDVLFIVAVEKQWRSFKASWLENDKEVNEKFDPNAERKAWLAREAAAAFGASVEKPQEKTETPPF